MAKTNYFIRIFVIVSIFLSCSKQVSYNVQGDPAVKFYTNNENHGNAPQNSISFNVVNIPEVTGNGLLNLSADLPDSINFPVFATRPVMQHVIVGAELNNDLVAEYNATHNTNYIPFPAGILDTDDLAAQISAGATTSEDPITITTDLSLLNELTETSYMAPIELTTVSNPAVGEITNSVGQVTYITTDVEQRIIKYLAVPADALGSLITSRSSWTSTFTPAPSTTGDIFDGSTSTYTRWDESPGQVDVNMQTTQDVTGIRLYTTNSTSRLPTQIDVYLSNVGINYDLIGSPERTDLTYTSSRTYILFYKAIPAQYIRLVLYYSTSSNSQNRRLAEFDVYAN
jgi:hypothetical protein